MTNIIQINLLSPGFTTPNGSAFLFPLIFFNNELKHSGIRINFFSKFSSAIYGADIIAVDSKFHKFMWEEQKQVIFQQFVDLKKNCDSLIYFDTTDSTGSLQTEILNYVDSYCKGQLLKNRKSYLKSFYGDRLYTDYIHKKFGVNDKKIQRSIPVKNREHLKKLKISWNSGLADYSKFGPFWMKIYDYIPLNFFLGFKKLRPLKKNINIHSRFGINYSKDTVAWQRKKITNLLINLDKKKLSRLQYFSELLRSKIVISPFGWGEITLKDFEAFLCNNLLFKPSMDHLDTWPNFFVNNKTYCSFSWDLSDFIKKLKDIEKNFPDYLDIVNYGNQNYLKYASKNGAEKFVNHFSNILT